MRTVTREYNPNNAVVAGTIDKLANEKELKIKNDFSFVEEEEYPYNPEFVEKLLESDRSKGRRIQLEDLWKL